MTQREVFSLKKVLIKTSFKGSFRRPGLEAGLVIANAKEQYGLVEKKARRQKTFRHTPAKKEKNADFN